MPLVAVLDSCVLFPMTFCDILLRLAQDGLYQPRWSELILEEVRRNLAKREGSELAARRVMAMSKHFPEAMVPRSIEEEHKLTLPDPDDRHVAATAVACGGAAMIVTLNLRDFPAAALPSGVRVEHPDAFLLGLLTEYPSTVMQCIHAQAAETGRRGKPQLTVPYVLRGLELAGAPRFAAKVRADLVEPQDP